MIRRHPRSTRTDTLFPYTTLFRSARLLHWQADCPHRLWSQDSGSTCRSRLPRRVGSSRRTCDRASHRASRSEEHTSELQSLMRISYAVFCLKKKTTQNNYNNPQTIHTITIIKANNSKQQMP